MNFLRFLYALISTNLQSSLSLRASFVMQLIFMAVNNLVFFSIWWIFFSNFEEINGWTLSELELMYGFTAGSFGLTVVFGGGVQEIARKIIDGGLDAYLVQPKSVLVHVVGSRSKASGWGDIVTAVVLFSLSGYLTLENLGLILLLNFTAALVLVSAGIMAQSLAFWLGPADHLARQLFEFVITFSVYPQTIFPFLFKIFLFTVIPAGFIGYLPVEVLRDFSLNFLVATVVFSILYVLVAAWVFHLGLKRYESGNRIAV